MWTVDDVKSLLTENSKAGTKMRLAPPRVLVVEDDLVLQPVITGIIRSIDRDIDVRWVGVADEVLGDFALRRSRKDFRQPYDLIIADIFTPGRYTGFDVWDACRKAYPELPVLLISALDRERFLSSVVGAHEERPLYLAKPLQAKGARQIVAKLLGYP